MDPQELHTFDTLQVRLNGGGWYDKSILVHKDHEDTLKIHFASSGMLGQIRLYPLNKWKTGTVLSDPAGVDCGKYHYFIHLWGKGQRVTVQ